MSDFNKIDGAALDRYNRGRECLACDGTGEVEVAQVYRTDEQPYAVFWPEDLGSAPKVNCPWCMDSR